MQQFVTIFIYRFRYLPTTPASTLCTNKNALEINTNRLHGSDEIYSNGSSWFNSPLPRVRLHSKNTYRESDSDSSESNCSALISDKHLKRIAGTTQFEPTNLANLSNVILEMKSRSKNNVTDVATVPSVINNINQSEQNKNDDISQPNSLVPSVNTFIAEPKQKPRHSPKPTIINTRGNMKKKFTDTNYNLAAPSNVHDNLCDGEIYVNCSDFTDEYQNLPFFTDNKYSPDDKEQYSPRVPSLYSSATYLSMGPVVKSTEEILLSETETYSAPLQKNLSVSCNVNMEFHCKNKKRSSSFSLSELATYRPKFSIPNFFTFGTKRKTVHLRGDVGCIFDDSEYQYIYELNPNTIRTNVKPFVRKRERVEPMPCYCHEDPNRYIKVIDLVTKKRKGVSTEEIYVDMTGIVYGVPNNSASEGDVTNIPSNEKDIEKMDDDNEDLVVKLFTENDKDNTDSEDKKNIPNVIMKKFSLLKQLFTPR